MRSKIWILVLGVLMLVGCNTKIETPVDRIHRENYELGWRSLGSGTSYRPFEYKGHEYLIIDGYHGVAVIEVK